MSDRIRIEKVNKVFPVVHAVKDASLTVKKGEVVLIIGPSGSGKNTLLRSVNRLETVTSGRIWIDEDEVTNPKTDIRKIREEAGMVFQSFNLFAHQRVIDNISIAPRHVWRLTKDESYEQARLLLKKVGLAEKEQSYPDQLSGGQQQRVAIARALDPELIKEVLDVMLDLAREGMTMLVVSDEMGFARDAADKVVFMDEGEVIEIAAPSKLFSSPEHERTKRFLNHIL